MSRRPRRNTQRPSMRRWHWRRSREKRTLSELAEQFDVHANQITLWKSQLVEGAVGVFGGEAKAEPAAHDSVHDDFEEDEEVETSSVLTSSDDDEGVAEETVIVIVEEPQSKPARKKASSKRATAT